MIRSNLEIYRESLLVPKQAEDELQVDGLTDPKLESQEISAINHRNLLQNNQWAEYH